MRASLGFNRCRTRQKFHFQCFSLLAKLMAQTLCWFLTAPLGAGTKRGWKDRAENGAGLSKAQVRAQGAHRRWDLNERTAEHPRATGNVPLCPCSSLVCFKSHSISIYPHQNPVSAKLRPIPGPAEDKLKFRMLRVNILGAEATNPHLFWSLGA